MTPKTRLHWLTDMLVAVASPEHAFDCHRGMARVDLAVIPPLAAQLSLAKSV
jgi:hypothetical protein